MKLQCLRVSNLAAIRDTEIEFGPGLNVLYGPNDLGKSTLVDAIRLALLLPHTSAYCDQFISWTGAFNPVIELTFETEGQRIWLVKKERFFEEDATNLRVFSWTNRLFAVFRNSHTNPVEGRCSIRFAYTYTRGGCNCHS